MPDGSTAPTIIAAHTNEDLAAARALFAAYVAWLGVDLSFQGVDEELARFPAGYDVVLLARMDGAAAGAVALRPLEPGICEMKRLFVPEAFRGHGLGRLLSLRLFEEARARGYTHMRLDTLERLRPALALYRALGFAECPPYYENPLSGVIYLEKAFIQA